MTGSAALAGCQTMLATEPTNDGGDSTADRLEFTLRSPALEASSDDTGQATMNRMFTREGANVSPPLVFEDVPADTETFVVAAFDVGMPDNPVHWVLWNLPVDDTAENRLPADIDHGPSLDSVEAVQGTNTYGNVGYDGPTSPGSEHRMLFEAYAIPGRLDIESGANYQTVKEAYEQFSTTSVGFSAVYER